MSPELDTYAITKKVKEVLTDNNLGKKQEYLLFSVVFWCRTQRVVLAFPFHILPY